MLADRLGSLSKTFCIRSTASLTPACCVNLAAPDPELVPAASVFRDSLQELIKQEKVLQAEVSTLANLQQLKMLMQELLSKCLSAYQDNQERIKTLESHLQQYGYTPQQDSSVPSDPLAGFEASVSRPPPPGLGPSNAPPPSRALQDVPKTDSSASAILQSLQATGFKAAKPSRKPYHAGLPSLFFVDKLRAVSHAQQQLVMYHKDYWCSRLCADADTSAADVHVSRPMSMLTPSPLATSSVSATSLSPSIRCGLKAMSGLALHASQPYVVQNGVGSKDRDSLDNMLAARMSALMQAQPVQQPSPCSQPAIISSGALMICSYWCWCRCEHSTTAELDCHKQRGGSGHGMPVQELRRQPSKDQLTGAAGSKGDAALERSNSGELGSQGSGSFGLAAAHSNASRKENLSAKLASGEAPWDMISLRAAINTASCGEIKALCQWHESMVHLWVCTSKAPAGPLGHLESM
ncbi:hypothetical protein MMC07_002617 [Pseudocyphellaria aurata]|nr:hypothetical protein [Pseudocyphellaria aurata]